MTTIHKSYKQPIKSSGDMYNLNNKSQQESFIFDDFKKFIFSSGLGKDLITDNTLGVYLIGSRGIGVSTDKSDFDIIAITTEANKRSLVQVKYNRRACHGAVYNYLKFWEKPQRFTNLTVHPLQLPLTNIVLYEKEPLASYIKNNKDFLANLGARLVLSSAKETLKQELGRLASWTKNKYNLILAYQVYLGCLDLNYIKEMKFRCTYNRIRSEERLDIDLKLLQIIDSIDEAKLNEDLMLVRKELSALLKA